MEHVIALDAGMNKYQPLKKIICYDDFDKGLNGWMDLHPNYVGKDFNTLRYSHVDKTQWGPLMLSSASFRLAGTHGSMDGTYSLKLSTRQAANPYTEAPAPGSLSHGIKRLTTHLPKGLRQFEMWYAYTPEQDRQGLSEQAMRAFGIFFDIQDDEYRYFIGARYLNAVNGEMVRRWQIFKAKEVTDVEWAYGVENDWCKMGIDAMWYGKRYADGSTDGFEFIPGGYQDLCYNESDDKINWSYLRLLIDTEKREYVELQSGSRVFDLRGMKPTLTAPYARIKGLFNPSMWVENDTDRRVFFYADSVVISGE
ncbi:DUF6772 family protein [Chitinophaga niabensis]|uniref:Uncharacterized protein n=1 Tax=Chitinophaga niabensis TaxID=536979 RepID=A0A1N6DM42_9BACT|nr:DUF6772 family protein [Chitinophaga niabensis]SIN71743.1 hypothetical protein SAMN04488055_0894 [Chitinophaga niabensis]